MAEGKGRGENFSKLQPQKELKIRKPGQNGKKNREEMKKRRRGRGLSVWVKIDDI